ncbi:hypothetical protein JKP88DRAFT_351736 [Tribonema minus]|uniref:Pentatricopeptide repeat-containing protein n=1 Tax=Tribonema minus TaxID=303371 RepID=A0A836C6U7_9STRA|nr:hypothetical protein JKP88DRAFT_351736 [Tribonema minus]
MSACSRAGNWQEALVLVSELRQRGMEPDLITGGQWCEALDVLDGLPAPLAPNVHTFNAALAACAAARQWDPAMELFHAMARRGVVDVVSFNTAISVLARMRQGQRAPADARTLAQLPPRRGGIGALGARRDAITPSPSLRGDAPQEMQAAGIRPDAVTFGALALACERSAPPLHRRASGLLREMREAGVAPTNATFASVISTVGSRHVRTGSQKCFVKREASVAPTTATFASVISTVGSLRVCCGAQKVLIRREAGVASTIGTFASIISTVGRVGADQAITLLNHMEALGTPPNAICLQAALTACERANSNNSADCALDVFTRMRARFGGGGSGSGGGGGARGADAEWTKRGPAAYATAIRACQKNGRWRDACALLGEMRAEPWCTSDYDQCDYDQWYSALALLAGDVPDPSRPVPTLKTYLAAMAGAASAGRWEETLTLLGGMEVQGPQQRGNTLALLGGMEVQGLQPGAVGYGAALEALATAGEHERGLALFEQTRGKAGFTPDVLCFTAALSCCHGVGDWQRALVYMREATEARLLPTRRMRLLAARTCRAAERHDELWGLYADMQMGSSGGGGSSSGGGGGDVAFLTEVLEGCGAARRADRVVELLYKQQSLCDDRALTLAALEALAAAAAAPAAADAILARAVAHGALRDPCLTLPAVDLAGLGPGAAAAVARHAARAAAAAAPQTGAGLTLVGARGGGAALAAAAQELERLGLVPQLARRRGGGSSAHVAAAALASWAAAAAAAEAAAEAELPDTNGATDAER